MNNWKHMLINWIDKLNLLVTGGSSGIGKSIINELKRKSKNN